ncbi:carbohydrate esterase family 1 protein [Polyplosphaeria fusca]|uniref:feruloyl esterase n=1 Tax=Polyplosphaeria fusca TaxID=682080 RepID=A0A9P4QLI7_9PLEO|nr:carbohydrate esterase family 1 protein [Polyplosphaeria fusca]
MGPHLGFLLLASICSLAFALPSQPVTSRAGSGCGKTQLFPGVTQYKFNLKSSGKDRSYSWHLPSDYDKNKQYPVVLGFHGSSTTGVLFELDTKLSESRFSGDKIMVYPNGLDGSWAGPSYHTSSTIDQDLQFVSDVVADLKSNFCVDEKRVYATGISNGGGFVSTIACSSTSNLFAAMASGSGSFYTDASGCSPASTPVPFLEIHGGADKTVFYEGGKGEGGPLPSIPFWLDAWAQRNECTDKIEETVANGDVHHLSWTCSGVEGLLQHYKVDDMGHCWADTEINLTQISVPQGPAPIQASSIMMQFFDKFSKP